MTYQYASDDSLTSSCVAMNMITLLTARCQVWLILGQRPLHHITFASVLSGFNTFLSIGGAAKSRHCRHRLHTQQGSCRVQLLDCHGNSHGNCSLRAVICMQATSARTIAVAHSRHLMLPHHPATIIWEPGSHTNLLAVETY